MRRMPAPEVPTRFRCGQCGNLTRFDVVRTRTTREFWHFSIDGKLTVEEEELVSEPERTVTCRWCGASDDRIEEVELDG